MPVLPKKSFILMLIVIQIVVSVATAGIVLSVQKIQSDTQYTVGDMKISVQTPDEAISSIRELYTALEQTGQYTLYFEDKKLDIPFSDIDLKIQTEKIEEFLAMQKDSDRFTQFMQQYRDTTLQSDQILPHVTINEGKLRTILMDFSQKINRKPTNARIFLEGDDVKVEPEQPGFVINIDHSVDTMMKSLYEHLKVPYKFVLSDNYEMQSVEPEINAEFLKQFNHILSLYTLEVPVESIKNLQSLVDIFEEVYIPVESELDYNKLLSTYKGLSLQDIQEATDKKDALNILSSAIYVTALHLPGNDVTYRLQSVNPTDFIEAGLEAIVTNKQGGLRFKNNTGTDYFLISKMTGNQLTMALVSNKAIHEYQYRIAVEVIQEIKPPTIYKRNNSLAKGDRHVLIEGVNGKVIDVYRRTYEGQVFMGQEKLFQERYEPTVRVIETAENVFVEETK